MITNPTLGSIGGTPGTTFFSTFFGGLITLAIIIGAIIFVFMLVAGAIQWIGSGGDKAAVEGAKGKITNALVGIIVLFAVFAIVNIIGVFFGGLDFLNLGITPLTP